MVTISGSSLLLDTLSALANPHRLQIISALINEANYVSELARQIGISRPLLIMHLKKLEDAGLVKSRLELSDDGKAMRFYEVINFNIQITPQSIAKVIK
ncbi:MAG: transcriptional regulator, ArsR family [Chloroflexi bacterium OLB14]|nr:MAG: transcriptional regulator, ArsR family [Chloroflexi bacterium OLB14]